MLNQTTLLNLVRAALAEDIGSGDATTDAVVPADLEVTANFNSRQACTCAGLAIAELVFRELDAKSVFHRYVNDGDACAPGTTLASVTGKARAILTGERLALNFLQRLCGIATMTRKYVEAVGKHPARILDTRKTTPGLRMLEKYAVSVGGGMNHRMGLYDRVMIKDNHRELASLDGPGGIQRAVQACRARTPQLEVEVEADTLDDVRDAIAAAADYILLDNMSIDEMAEAVKLVGGRCLTEASGGITLERIAAIAATGVDFISVGALTHSVPAVDISLEIEL